MATHEILWRFLEAHTKKRLCMLLNHCCCKHYGWQSLGTIQPDSLKLSSRNPTCWVSRTSLIKTPSQPLMILAAHCIYLHVSQQQAPWRFPSIFPFHVTCCISANSISVLLCTSSSLSRCSNWHCCLTARSRVEFPGPGLFLWEVCVFFLAGPKILHVWMSVTVVSRCDELATCPGCSSSAFAHRRAERLQHSSNWVRIGARP